MNPFNIKILDTNSAKVKNLRAVTSQAIYEGATANLHPEGIFSTTIFGRVGSEERSGIFGAIDIPVPVFDPTIFEYLMNLKALYKDIINESKYARFDTELKDFVAADPINGETGFAFFMKHWKKIEFKQSKSKRRSMYIQLVEKYKDVAEIKRLVVMPAGMRDIEVNSAGRLEENEINEYYRKVLAYARLLVASSDGDMAILNRPRRFLQAAIQELWNYLYNLFGGKGGFLYEKATSRRIFDGTRNVITALDTVRSHIGDGRGITINQLTLGVLQTAKGARPLTIGLVRRALLDHGVFEESLTSTFASLIDVKTLKRKKVEVSFSTKDRWLTADGLGRVIESYREISIRKEPIFIEGHYLGLIYDSEGTVKLFWDIDDMPEGLDRNVVRPATLTDILVLFCLKEWERRYSFPARYPIAGQGSVFPSEFKVITTVPDKMVKTLNDNWEVDEHSVEFISYPDMSGSFYDSMSLHPASLAGAGADHDGDTSSNNIALTDESIVEIQNILRSAKFYLSPGGGFKKTMNYWTNELITHNMNP